jgi:hypothetical protein
VLHLPAHISIATGPIEVQLPDVTVALGSGTTEQMSVIGFISQVPQHCPGNGSFQMAVKLVLDLAEQDSLVSEQLTM